MLRFDTWRTGGPIALKPQAGLLPVPNDSDTQVSDSERTLAAVSHRGHVPICRLGKVSGPGASPLPPENC